MRALRLERAITGGFATLYTLEFLGKRFAGSHSVNHKPPDISAERFWNSTRSHRTATRRRVKAVIRQGRSDNSLHTVKRRQKVGCRTREVGYTVNYNRLLRLVCPYPSVKSCPDH